MEKKYIYSLFALASFTLASCTKEIDIDLDTAEPKLVVESLLTDNNEPFTVKLTKTTPYFSDGEDYVSSAVVIITDNAGNTDTLSYTANGIYSTITDRQGVVGRTYTLTILNESEVYTASSSMVAKVALDTITYEYNEGGIFSDPGYNCAANFQEMPGVTNYYRINFYRNDTLMTDPFKYFVVDDKFTQGNYIVSLTPYLYQSNDSCKIELLCLDKEYYTFLVALSTQAEATGGPFDPIPSNPPSNVSNGAVGFFAAVTRSTKKIVIP